MKRSVILLMLTLGASSAFAQFNYGIKGGVNVVNMALNLDPQSPAPATEYNLSFHAGVYASYPMGERFSVNPEMLVSMKGYQVPGSSSAIAGGSDKFATRLSYFSLPILVGYSLKKFLIVAGPEISYLLWAKTKVGDEKYNASDQWSRKLDMGAVAGLSYQIVDKVSLQFRYIHGLLNVAEIQTVNAQGNVTGEDAKSQNRVFQLSAGYRLN